MYTLSLSTMSSSIIESMSSRKLSYLVLILATGQILCFFLGALISPSPNTSMTLTATKCVDEKADINGDEWFYPRGDQEGKCKRIDSFSSKEASDMQLTAENIVFSFQMPHAREGRQLDYR